MKRASRIERQTLLTREDEIWIGHFDAMANPCEILMALEDEELAEKLLQVAAREAWRIEQKFSRYRADSMVSRINTSVGKTVAVDLETTQLLNFAFQCYELSNGLFDITCGVLRKAWPFRQDSACPSQELVDSLLPLVGLKKVEWQSSEITLPPGMQIDLGGIGKEYAADRALRLMAELTDEPILMNLGGDIAFNRLPDEETPWRIGSENQDQQNQAEALMEVRSGALATSGNTQRFLICDGKRYGHLLNPITGWPVEESPLSVTVAESNCTRAGMLATLAMLQGTNAEKYLQGQEVKFWVQR